MQYINKKLNAICFDDIDLKQIFEAPSRSQLLEEVVKSGYSWDEIKNSRAKMQEITDKVKIINQNKDKEIFLALYVLPKFYPGKSKICFICKNDVSQIKLCIKTLEELKSLLQEYDLSDFLLLQDDGFRSFQLKFYKGETSVDKLFVFIREKLNHYANNLGNVNLLISMQSEGAFCGNFFQDLHEDLNKLTLKGGGHILISYNENDKFDVLNTVYPTLGTIRIKHETA